MKNICKKINNFGGDIDVPMPCFKAHAKRFDNRIVLVLRNQLEHDFALYFLRMIEFYNWHALGEILGSRRKPINRDDYLAWYDVIQDGFSYNERYFGMYICSEMIMDFYKEYLPYGLTKEERMILKTFQNLGALKVDGQKIRKMPGVFADLIIINEPYCIVDKYAPDGVLGHELSHMFYNHIPKYAKHVENIFRGIKGEYKKKIVKILAAKDYSKDVMPEEWACNVIGERATLNKMAYRLDDETKKKIASIKRMFRDNIKAMESIDVKE